ncbi:MAG: hypothetical protein COA58_03050 [Bacteroidetes bacterium]|nr:MAG: hypothetical protein COA58_03050 [Bacteroidota bacterium]
MNNSKQILVAILLVFTVVSSYALPHNSVKPSEISIITHDLAVPEYIELRKSYEIESPFGMHITYKQFIHNKEVLFAGVRIHWKKNGTYSIQDFLIRENIENVSDESTMLLSTESGLREVRMANNPDLVYPTTQFIDLDGTMLLEIDDYKHAKKDTTLHSQVFWLNPINTANTSYGGNYTDNLDQTNPSLDSQLRWVSNTVQFENDTFFFESEFLSFTDISAPVDGHFFSINDSVQANRDNDWFEYLNVYYHINVMGQYANDLGYDALTQHLEVDVHAFGTADNSAYSPDDHTLQFGIGGVDDGEDGEVVIHEFTHSLSEVASPDNTVGNERAAMEEGSCDYFAKAYSRSLNDNTPNKIFSWDGHNQFWDGFVINQKRDYPIDLKGSKDGDRDMWATALMCAHDFIGRNAMDSILLEHFYYQKANSTMAEMAQIILTIDSGDFGNRYHSQLKQCFVDAGFIARGASVSNPIQKGFKVLNQNGFIVGDGNLTIEINTPASYKIYNTAGQLIQSGNPTSKLTLSPSDFSKGLYVVYFTINGKSVSQKILR